MKKLNFKGRAKQAGFTLIELIVVIVILGIMAATALPKFMDLGADARLAKAQAAHAAVKSTMAMAEAASKTQNTMAATLGGYTLQGSAPKAADLMAMAGVADDYEDIAETPTSLATALFIATDTEHPECGFSYAEAVVAAAVPPAGPTLTTAAALGTAPTLADCE